MTHYSTLILGIGSDHGDDRAGWRVIELLIQSVAKQLTFRSLRVPLQLLDIDERYEQWLIVDAVIGTHSPGTTVSWDWSDAPSDKLEFFNTHSFSLLDVLQLAHTLGRLPPRVRIWGIGVSAARCVADRTGQTLSECVENAAHAVAQQIIQFAAGASQLAGDFHRA